MSAKLMRAVELNKIAGSGTSIALTGTKIMSVQDLSTRGYSLQHSGLPGARIGHAASVASRVCWQRWDIRYSR